MRWSVWLAATAPNATAPLGTCRLRKNQLRDYEARLGQPFLHSGYLDQLAALRDQLKAGLSGAASQEGEPTVSELAEQINALRAAHTVEAPAERSGTRRIAAEEPVTARIRRRAGIAAGQAKEEPTTFVEDVAVAGDMRLTALSA